MRTLALGLLCASMLFGQLESNTVTVTASRSLYVQPDQVVFTISSPTDLSSGLLAAGLTGVQSTSSLPGAFFTFTLAVPLNNTADAIAKLIAVQSKLNLSFNMQGTQASPQLLGSQKCSNADLIADARVQAQRLATAAGMSLGPVTALSEAGPVTPAFAAIYDPAFRTGSFSFAAPSFASFLMGGITAIQPGGFIAIRPPSGPSLTCSLTVKFGLVRY